MRPRTLTTAFFLFLCALFAFALPAVADSDSDSDSERGRRIRICHFPPGNPANFQTITVRGRAWRHHARHGDLLGSCAANCEDICDDGDA
ncbi:MAG: hypothetical protein GY953_04860, partial [bacterium]|nr:hypothetical protein [bacterium]